MADTMTPQTPPPKKLFKPSSITKTPTRLKPSPQSTQQQIGSLQRTQKDAPRSVASVASDDQSLDIDNIAKSTNLAPLTDIPAASDKLPENAGSDTTGETPTGLVENYILTPTDTTSRSTDARSPLEGEEPQEAKSSSPSFKEKIARARESGKETADGSNKGIASKPTEALETAESSLSAAADNATEALTPIKLVEYFKEQGNPEMSSFVTALIGDQSSGSSEDTPRATKSPANETQTPNNQADRVTSDQKNLNQKDSNQKNDKPDASQDAPTGDKLVSEPADVSKMVEGAFRNTEGGKSTAEPINKMGEPSASEISQTAQPAIPNTASDTKRQPSKGPQQNGQNSDTHVVDNMGRPAHVERSFEIPFQRPAKRENSYSPPERQRTESTDLGDVKDLPSVENLPSVGNLPSTDDLSDIPEDDSEDPPEEVLDPSVHSTSSSSITPIPKIPKISHIDSSPPAGLPRLAQGLAGHAIDDVGNIVDESGEVLGHATGDLPAMVGKKVSEDGEVYGDGGEIVGYVSENFIDPPTPTEIPGDVLGGLRVDHKGNILDSDGNIIGKFHQPPQKKGSPKAESSEKPNEGKPKVNAHTGGSPSDLFLDVKSTTDGIQLTIRIPTTFSQPPPESKP
ncbi:hypothetical protein E0Z10_g152 [Xylaria hypoxylon]|uniref:Uncharacterized protein n=1 Tax=Xylaria hypoxylon TaxID=37992 RepID=A0A4Z0ZAE2_9PEZI|nr:hypothetical protein E0Z10_g152 [Xylaria hypoxylon]